MKKVFQGRGNILKNRFHQLSLFICEYATHFCLSELFYSLDALQEFKNVYIHSSMFANCLCKYQQKRCQKFTKRYLLKIQGNPFSQKPVSTV